MGDVHTNAYGSAEYDQIDISRTKTQLNDRGTNSNCTPSSSLISFFNHKSPMWACGTWPTSSPVASFPDNLIISKYNAINNSTYSEIYLLYRTTCHRPSTTSYNTKILLVPIIYSLHTSNLKSVGLTCRR